MDDVLVSNDVEAIRVVLRRADEIDGALLDSRLQAGLNSLRQKVSHLEKEPPAVDTRPKLPSQASGPENVPAQLSSPVPALPFSQRRGSRLRASRGSVSELPRIQEAERESVDASAASEMAAAAALFRGPQSEPEPEPEPEAGA